MDLSIICLSMPHRRALLARLLDTLSPQICKGVELIIGIDDRTTPVWQKRNHYLAAASGQYVCYMDDDDLPSTNYVDAIRAAIEIQPDCVGFKVQRYEDGRIIGEAIHSMRYERYNDRMIAGMIHMERTPNHLNPVKIELARQVGFRDDVMEDVDYARRLRPLLVNESFVDDYLYHYYFVSPRYRTDAR